MKCPKCNYPRFSFREKRKKDLKAGWLKRLDNTMKCSKCDYEELK